MTPCATCEKPIPEGSAFCNVCGARQPMLSGAAPRRGPAGPHHSATPPPDEPERDLWQGCYSGRTAMPLWILCAFFGVIALYAAFAAFSGAMRAVAIVLAFAPPAFIGWTVLIAKLSTRYRLTNQRLFISQGIVSRTHSEVELVRVDDVTVRQGLVQRAFNVGDVVLATTDANESAIEILGVDDPMPLKETIRAEVRRLRARVLRMESV